MKKEFIMNGTSKTGGGNGCLLIEAKQRQDDSQEGLILGGRLNEINSTALCAELESSLCFQLIGMTTIPNSITFLGSSIYVLSWTETAMVKSPH